MDKTLADIIQLLCRTFPDDPSAPSLVVSWLEEHKQWYIAVVRYRQRFGQGKRILTRNSSTDLGFLVEVTVKEVNELCQAVANGRTVNASAEE